MNTLIFLLALLAVLSFVLTFWRWAVSMRFPLHRSPPITAANPAALAGLTVLKPLKGCNSETRRCLRSWFTQEYPGPLQILCGVASRHDPVCEVVNALIAEFPGIDAELVICAEDLGVNGKVSTLRQLEPRISHALLMISDCDVEVRPNFAAGITPLLMEPGAGMVNCFYRLANPVTAAMRWEAIAINADFWSQVLQARSFGPIDFALGAVMSMPRTSLEEIGGFAHLADYLADDYELGRSIARSGGRIEFADVVVDCREAKTGWREVWKHQLRWARTIRACRPGPYFLSLLGNSTLWPVLWFAVQRDRKAGIFCAAALVFRMISAARQQRRMTQTNGHFAYAWMTPVKDLLDVFIWGAAFWGNHVEWRGMRYRILGGGKLLKVQSS